MASFQGSQFRHLELRSTRPLGAHPDNFAVHSLSQHGLLLSPRWLPVVDCFRRPLPVNGSLGASLMTAASARAPRLRSPTTPIPDWGSMAARCAVRARRAPSEGHRSALPPGRRPRGNRRSSVKEEAYSRTQCNLVAPENFSETTRVHERWMRLAGRRVTRNFRGQWSGSGRASGSSARRLRAGPPPSRRPLRLGLGTSRAQGRD